MKTWWNRIGATEEDRHRNVLWLIGSIIGALFVIWAFSSCTVAPKVTEPSRPSSWAKANIIGYDRNGIFVKSDWVRVYFALLKAYGGKLPVTEQLPGDGYKGITTSGSHFHVDWETNKRFADLKYIEAAAP